MMMSGFDPTSIRSAVAWVDDHIEIIDQTLLPGSYVIRELRAIADVVDAIERLAVRGAPSVGACGALGMVVALDEAHPKTAQETKSVLERAAERIGKARPTAVNLTWAVNRVYRSAVDGEDPAEIRSKALAEANAIIAEDAEACRLIGENGRVELADRHRILTHCNTGRLATAGWGTAAGVIYAKAAAGDPVQLYASETRPLLQGARLTAWEFMDAGVNVTLLPDGAAGTLLFSRMADAVIVGADRIAANGDTANKIGTFSHAVNARNAGVPFYVAAPLSTFDVATPTGTDIVIEQRTADEVRSFQGSSSAPAGVPVWNPAFDVTPADYITAIITERGVLRPPYSESIASMFADPKGDT